MRLWEKHVAAVEITVGIVLVVVGVINVVVSCCNLADSRLNESVAEANHRNAEANIANARIVYEMGRMYGRLLKGVYELQRQGQAHDDERQGRDDEGGDGDVS